jgi:hypothetical protein
MKALEYTVEIGASHDIRLDLPASTRPGRARILVLLEEDDENPENWMQGISREWHAELSDPREDIYTLASPQPVKYGHPGPLPEFLPRTGNPIPSLTNEQIEEILLRDDLA